MLDTTWKQIPEHPRYEASKSGHPCPAGMECCHANDIKDDNRADNLRWGMRQDNMDDRVRNRKPDKYWGVCHSKSMDKPFRAYLNYGGIKHHLGYFTTAEKAAIAYNNAITNRGINQPLNIIPVMLQS